MTDEKTSLSSSQESGDQKPVTHVMDLTEDHYALLKTLETNKVAETSENPRLLQHYFRDLKLQYDRIDDSLRRDASRWRVSLVTGFFVVTRMKPRFGNKVRVKVEQD